MKGLSKFIKKKKNSRKKSNTKNKYVCRPYLKFSDPLPETHLIGYLAQEANLNIKLPNFVYLYQDFKECVPKI